MGCGCKKSSGQKPLKQVTKKLPSTAKIGPSIRRSIEKRPAK